MKGAGTEINESSDSRSNSRSPKRGGVLEYISEEPPRLDGSETKRVKIEMIGAFAEERRTVYR